MMAFCNGKHKNILRLVSQNVTLWKINIKYDLSSKCDNIDNWNPFNFQDFVQVILSIKYLKVFPMSSKMPIIKGRSLLHIKYIFLWYLCQS